MTREEMDGYIETLYDDGGNPTAHYIKGSHEDLDDFVACLRDDWRIDVDADYVTHCYMRFTPQRDGYFTARPLPTPARGATPVTYFDRSAQEHYRHLRAVESREEGRDG